MSKRRGGRNARMLAVTGGSGALRTRDAVPTFANGYQVFEAAKRSGYRGYFFFPTLEPHEMMPQETRQTTAEKSQWLYNNVGAVSMVIDGLGLDEAATGLWIKAMTENEDFNRAVTSDFDEQGKEPRVFHSAAVESVYSVQWMMRRHIRLHGEIFGQFLRPAEGSASPSMHFINAWQCTNAQTNLDQSKWREGQMLNEMGRVLQYRFVTGSDRKNFTDVSADDVLHFHDKFLNGQSRGMGALAPVVRKLLTLDDIEKAESLGTLLRSRLAYKITRKDEDGRGPALVLGAKVEEEVTTSDGSKVKIQKVNSLSGDAEADVATLPAGADIGVVESMRGSAAMEFTRFLLTDVAYCTNYPPEYVFWLAGVTNGTMVRMLLKRVQLIKNTIRQFQIIQQFLERWYVFWLWQRIKAGAYDKVPGGIPLNWWKRKVILPADDTVDVGREGRLYDERVGTGKMSPDAYHGAQAEDAGDVEDAVIGARERRETKLAQYNERRTKAKLAPLRYEDLWPATSNVATVAAGKDNPAPGEDD